MKNPLTAIEALEAFKALLPVDAEYLAVQEEHTIGYSQGYSDSYTLWNHAPGTKFKIIAESKVSFEQALAIAKAARDLEMANDENMWIDQPYTERGRDLEVIL